MRVWDENPTGLSSPGREIMVAVGAIPTTPAGAKVDRMLLGDHVASSPDP